VFVSWIVRVSVNAAGNHESRGPLQCHFSEGAVCRPEPQPPPDAGPQGATSIGILFRGQQPLNATPPEQPPLYGGGVQWALDLW